MRLIQKDKKEDGWTPVSAPVLPFIAKLPTELVETRSDGDGGWARLTDKGETVLAWT